MWIILTTEHGEIEIVIDKIVSMRDTISTENGQTALTLMDGLRHVVTQTRKEIHAMLDDA
jgi:hypothetical protein